MSDNDRIMKEEKDALILFVADRSYGNHLRAVAERRLCDLNEIEMSRSIKPDKIIKKRHNGKRACINKLTGVVYESMLAASKAIKVTYDALVWDIYKEKYKYNIYQL